MLTRTVRWQLGIFATITVLALGAVAVFYLRVPETLGIGRYTVTANFAASGGLYPNANVTYRGSTVGRVTAVELTDDLSVDVRMRLRSEVAIPADITAAAKSVSAIGEQYVELIPMRDHESGEPLRNGSVIDRSHTTLSGNVAGLLREAQDLVNSLDHSRLNDVLRETATAFDHAGPEVARLIRSTSQLVGELDGAREDTTALIEHLGPFLDAQNRSGQNITSLADGLARFTTELRAADPQLRTLLQTAPAAAEAATDTFAGIRPSFPMLAANLANFGRIGVIYHKSLEQTLVVLPAVTAVLISSAEQLPPDEGTKVDFKLGLDDPPPCNVGFIPPTQIRSPGDQTLREIPDDMYCKVPQSSSLVVRGARNYPCQEFPGKRAPTVALCRDPAGYVPMGNQAWRGPTVAEDTPITDPRNILPPNKFPYIPPDADYDPGPPVADLPPGVPPGPGPAEFAPYPLPVPPVTPGPPPPPLPYNPPPELHVPPYGQHGPAGGHSSSPPAGAAEHTAAEPATAHVAVYDSANGLFQHPNGDIGVFTAADAKAPPAENWVDLLLTPRRS
ncbi:MCE family protein [Mycolicibacterium vaccae]|uniref:Virulence factor Mce family protein n=1 Tax=Mycolicibacterium vaccae ATCC 25954 TaxID=1194972 RepID=K0USP1_MYCVA|nr:MCE family protein [Mycolicibacterium vaccae]EJZ05633.1 virulence factor Mce family protein [Mycolicibacterium vaccae ATCC 25954]MCV7063624.1 MCE family protein [Mycolicibacterium vaccae]